MDKDIRIVFMGTPSFARNVLEGLVNNGYNVVLCVSQEDKERDRKGNLVETAVKSYAKSKGIDIFTPHRIRDEYEEVLKYKPDIVITCAYGQIIPKVILDYPRLGCINVHGSLLPKYRGGAPIHWAIMNGEKETGISIMYMSEKMDAGDIISQRSMVIGDGDILDDVYEKMSFLGRDLLLDTLPSIIDGTNARRVQDESLVSFGYNVKREEERLDFNWSSRDVYNRIRGLSTVPGAYFTLNGKRIKGGVDKNMTRDFIEFIKEKNNDTSYLNDLVTVHPIEEKIDEAFSDGHAMGIDEGKKIGLERGEEIGVAKGIKQGIEQGRNESTQNIINKLIEKGLSDNEISNLLDINHKQLTKLKRVA